MYHSIFKKLVSWHLGTRYRRRGIDETGACANYVETEQIIQTSEHTVSFVQVRGSMPVFFTQPGIKYKPPPRLEKGNTPLFSSFPLGLRGSVSQRTKNDIFPTSICFLILYTFRYISRLFYLLVSTIFSDITISSALILNKIVLLFFPDQISCLLYNYSYVYDTRMCMILVCV